LQPLAHSPRLESRSVTTRETPEKSKPARASWELELRELELWELELWELELVVVVVVVIVVVDDVLWELELVVVVVVVVPAEGALAAAKLANSLDQPGIPLDMEGAIDESSGCKVETSARKSRPPPHRHSTAESAVALTSVSGCAIMTLLAAMTSLIR